MDNILKKKKISFYKIIIILQKYWLKKKCTIYQPIDLPVGAGTFHNKTFFNAISNKPASAAYIQGSRRPADGRFGKNTNRLQHYYQFQVIIKPSPKNIQQLYINSLKHLGINTETNDIKFIEDNWSNPTLGAWGVGWEVWLNGMEITQFTYFQKVGGLNCNPITVEITYGLERIAMCIQKINSVYDIIWHNNIITYKEIFLENEIEQSNYNFQYSDKKFLFSCFKLFLKEAKRLIKIKKKKLIFPAYEKTLQAIHKFNLLDARNVISNHERQRYILKISNIIKLIAKKFIKTQKKINK